MLRKKVCLLVDAYSTANRLAGVVAAYGYPCIHVQSSPQLPDAFLKTFQKYNFVDFFIYDSDLKKIVSEIKTKQYEVHWVITGAESGVLLGDQLANEFGVCGNDPDFSLARRDKFLMAETLKIQGIRSLRHHKSSNLKDILRWVEGESLETVVLKPLSSSGTDGFYICSHPSEIENAFNNLHLKSDVFGKINHEILIQEYVEGQEYAVNTVSHRGKHFTSEIWKTNKKRVDHSKVYDVELLLSECDENFSILEKYTFQVLDALKIHYGPAHTEIIMDPSGNPVLIETGARLMGSMEMSLVTEAYGTNALLLTAESYLAADEFLRRRQAKNPKMKKHAAMVQIISRASGMLKEYHLDDIKELTSFYGIDFSAQPGAKIRKTCDSATNIALIYLINEDFEKMSSDYKKIREMEEKNQIFTMEMQA